MVEQTHTREATTLTTIPTELRAQEQRWLAGHIRPLQRLHHESDHSPHETHDIRRTSQTVFESTESVRTYRWATYAADTADTNETGAESRLLASVFEFVEYYDPEVDE